MKIYVDKLRNLPVEISSFFGYDISDGWIKVDNDVFGRVLLDGAQDERSSLDANPEDIIIEEEDLAELKYEFENITDVLKFADRIKKLTLEVK